MSFLQNSISNAQFTMPGLGQGIMGDLVLSNVKEEKWNNG